MQWNANAIKNKTTELSARLIGNDIDICIIQESKLTKADKNPPRVTGYKAAMRSDRIGLAGGGLITYVKDSIVFDAGDKRSLTATESTSMRVRLNKKTWVNISNIYVPPQGSTGQDIEFNTTGIPISDYTFVAGDLNGHSPLWDLIQPPDDRGSEIEDWVIENELTVLNDGSPTRVNPATGNESTPDVTLVGKKLKEKCTWEVGEQIGSSDHLPITTTIHKKITHQPVMGREGRWKRNGVDWSKFRNVVEEKVSKFSEEANLIKRATRFTECLKETAYTEVGKTKPRKTTKIYMTPTVRKALQKRNKARKNVKQNRQAWLESCKEAQEEIRKAKEESWRDLLDSAIAEDNDAKMWRIVGSLKGCPDSNSPNEAITHNGRTITSNKKKADIFVQHYANVSKHQFSKEERKLHRTLKRKLGAETVEDEYCQDFTLPELKKAIAKMKRKGAAGPDEIPPSFLKELGPLALEELLQIYNISFQTATVPQLWRLATIIPLLKANKPASELGSFRPISLTSCLAKLFERMLGERLYHLAETKGLFNHQQAGFRKGRGCDDQINRVIQAIQDGFNEKKMHRSVLVLLDFSKAYDTVWRERLLMTLLDQGVPTQMVRWLYRFLENRLARVKFNGTMSKTRIIHQGLPQGSVLSPILFLFYINELAKILPRDTLNSLFADDVSVLATARTKEEAQAIAQRTVDVVVHWAAGWKVTLNAGKSEASLFSTDVKEATWMPEILIEGTPAKKIRNPRLLGVLLDRNLMFGPHVDHLVDQIAKKQRIIGAVANTDWGWRKEDLLKIYTGHVSSVSDYAGFSWIPSTAKSHLERLERAQNKALRLVTGQYRSTRVEALRAECGLPSMKVHMDRLIVKSREKAIRLPEDHPRRLAAEGDTTHRRKQTNWRAKSLQLSRILPQELDNRVNLEYFPEKPWISAPHLEIYPLLEGVDSRLDEIPIKKAAALKRIREVNAQITVYTDGSASGGIYEGGSAMIATRGDPEALEVIETRREKGAAFTCSYEEEVQAMITAARWIVDNCTGDEDIMICTDSQSLCMAMQSYNTETSCIRSMLHNHSGRVMIQWIPGHSEVPGNDLADEAAKEATELEAEQRSISFRSACMMVNKSIPNNLEHPRTSTVYSRYSKEREKELKSRADQVLIAQIRSGKHKAFRQYQHDLDNTVSPICQRCESGENHDLEHWFLRCNGTLAAKQQLFFDENMEEGLALLTKCPANSIALARRTLLGATQ